MKAQKDSSLIHKLIGNRSYGVTIIAITRTNNTSSKKQDNQRYDSDDKTQGKLRFMNYERLSFVQRSTYAVNFIWFSRL